MDKEAVIDAIRKNLGDVNIPGPGSKVFKDECAFTFTKPESDTGLFTSLKTFISYAEDMLGVDHARSGSTVYLHQKWTKVLRPKEESEDPKPTAAPTKLAIGVEGGFELDSDKWDWKKDYSVVVMPSRARVAFPDDALPEKVTLAVNGVLESKDADRVEEKVVWEEELIKSKFVPGLKQVDNGIKISPKPEDWKCADCDLTNNLWLNLHDGHIGCGRAYHDGTGGNGHAKTHFEATGKAHPICVKLGTITKNGGDVFSYADGENDMCENPDLADHLAHFGINIMKLEKTEKTMTELNIALNLEVELSAIEEKGEKLIPLCGPGYIGLENMGNTCYMNSCLQVMFSLPEFKQRWFDFAEESFKTAKSIPAEDFTAQMSKLAVGLLSDRYVPKDAPAADGGEVKEDGGGGGGGGDGDAEEKKKRVEASVRPKTLRHLVGRDHFEFSTGRQQDAMEYWQHFMEFIKRAERSAPETKGKTTAGDVTRHFQLVTESRLQGVESKEVRYKEASENFLTLGIPLDTASNLPEVHKYQERAAKRAKLEGESKSRAEKEDPKVLPIVKLEDCLKAYATPEAIPDYSFPNGVKGPARRSTGIKKFPKYLVMQVRKYTIDLSGAKKLEVHMEVPDELDLEFLRSNGLQDGEVEMPEGKEEAGPQPDADVVSSIVGMGFSENGAKRAALANNNNLEAAMNWVMAHMGDADFNDPLPSAGGSKAASPLDGADIEKVSMIMAMGFKDTHAARALSETGNAVDRAIDWLMARVDSLDSLDAPPAAGGDAEVADGPAKYELMAFISHGGSSIASGHYVCHIKKDGRWAFYNDRAVHISVRPPREHGYVYLYRRKE